MITETIELDEEELASAVSAHLRGRGKPGPWKVRVDARQELQGFYETPVPRVRVKAIREVKALKEPAPPPLLVGVEACLRETCAALVAALAAQVSPSGGTLKELGEARQVLVRARELLGEQ